MTMNLFVMIHSFGGVTDSTGVVRAWAASRGDRPRK